MSEIKPVYRFFVILQSFISVGVLVFFVLYSCRVVTGVKRFAIPVAVL